jgi:hypothetical protein
MKDKTIVITIAMVALVAALGTMTTTQIQQAFGDKKALDEAGTLCPPGHECTCTAASGVYHDYDPASGRTFNINNGCTSDNGQ